MKKLQPSSLLGILAFFTGSFAFAQNFQPLGIQSGFNADVVANGVGTALSSTSTDVDGVANAFVSRDYQLTSSSTPLSYGLPADGKVASVVTSTPGLTYQLANYSGNNSLKLSNTNDSGTLVFSNAVPATKLYLLATTGSGEATVTVTVTFADNTTQIISGVVISDWYNASGFALQGFGRIDRNTNNLDAANGTNPRLYQFILDIDAANQTKAIQSVTITKTSTPQGHANIFALTADVYSDCAPPVVQATTNILSDGATVNWTASASAQASTYSVYYSTSSTAPSSTATPQLVNISGTSTPIGNLNPNTTYYFWVKTNCTNTTGQSVWSFAGNFKTLCGAMSSLSENFDSNNTGSIVPDCWIRLMGSNGSMTISATSPASGTRNIYQYSSTSQSPSAVILPELSNISAGTHWLRFRARVNTATGTLNVGYLTNTSDLNSFVLIQALSLTNTAYDSSSEFTVVVPNTVPSTARLAIMNTADSKSYYWDDVSWEAIPACLKPSAPVISNITAAGAQISWTAPSTAPSDGYEFYYDTVNTAPAGTATAMGSTAAGVVSAPVSGLSANTTYYIWVRSVCGASSKSDWSLVSSFKTLCLPIPSLFENFDTYATGSIVPDCWDRMAGSGSQTISATSPASGSRNIYQYTVSSASPTYAVLPPMTNINSGTHQLRFKARCTSSAGGTLNVGYVTDLTDPSSFVLLQALSITNTSYSAANSEFTVSVPTTLPANARLAIHSSRDGKTYYWDDIYWESANLSTLEATAKNKTKVYPNPFSEVLFISDIKDVKEIKVSDVAGRVLKVIDNPSKEINLNSLNSGLYLITLYFKDGSQNTVKTIKK